MEFHVCERVNTVNGSAVVVKVERQTEGPVPGRFTLQFDDGTTIENFPSYQIKKVTA